MSEDAPARRVTLETDGHVLLMGLDRAEKRNAFDGAMLDQLALAYGVLDRDPNLRCGVLFAHGDHFTGGLDLVEIGPRLGRRGFVPPENGLDPLGVYSRPVRKPVVIAVQGWCLTIGIELLLAADIAVAASDTRFAQIEVKRGIMPAGGATTRWPARSGWGDAMRYLLTGDELDAAEAHRVGLVQEVVPPGAQVKRARELAAIIAAQAPLAVQATLESARLAVREGQAAAAAAFVDTQRALLDSADAGEGLSAFIERRPGVFKGE